MKFLVNSIIMALVLSFSVFGKEFVIRGGIGLGTITKYSAGSWDPSEFYKNKGYWGLSFHYSKLEIIKVGLSFSSIKEALNPDKFGTSDAIYGNLNINKIAVSILAGKDLLNRLFPYFIFEPGIYLLSDKTEAFDELGRQLYMGIFHRGHLIGFCIGGGFDCYVDHAKHFGVSVTGRYDIASMKNVWINYPGVLISFLFSL